MTGVKLLDYWSPPEGAGAPIACLATSFTFDADFFTQDCLARFLSLSMVNGEGDAISSLAAVLEEEMRLAETQVTVLVDRSTPAEKRNLRWDLLPVAVPGGLLHAKTAVLIWSNAARIILGSANLTAAGYRRQIELAVSVDLDVGCLVPRHVFDHLVTELRALVALTPGPAAGPTGRASGTLDLLAARIASLDLPRSVSGGLRLSLAPAHPGISPLDRLGDVWKGTKPLRATVVSPFWDDAVPAPALAAVRAHLTGQPARKRQLTLVAAIDPGTGAVQAPPSLAEQGGNLAAFDPPDTEVRLLHAKLLLVESDDWVAALIGSSNATQSGYGLHPTRGHHELNLWVGCPAGSPTAKHLRALTRVGSPIESDEEAWAPVPDEDEATAPQLPLGFMGCLLDASAPPRALLELHPAALPPRWEVRSPAGRSLLTADEWRGQGAPRNPAVDLQEEVLPAYLVVQWDLDGELCEATWTVNVRDITALPPPAELAELPADVLLAALASTRPLPIALEDALRRRERITADGDVQLDPLRRFDDSGLLLQRTRHVSLALWRLQERLGQPASSLEVLHWRLNGLLGPVALARALCDAQRHNQALPGEAHFIVAEIALTVAAVDWAGATAGLDPTKARARVDDALAALIEQRQTLPPAPQSDLDSYLDDALTRAAQPW